MPSKRLLNTLLISAVLMPAAIVVFEAFGRLLSALGDAAGGVVLERLALVGGVAWLLVLLALLLVLGLRQALVDHEDEPGAP